MKQLETARCHGTGSSQCVGTVISGVSVSVCVRALIENGSSYQHQTRYKYSLYGRTTACIDFEIKRSRSKVKVTGCGRYGCFICQVLAYVTSIGKVNETGVKGDLSWHHAKSR